MAVPREHNLVQVPAPKSLQSGKQQGEGRGKLEKLVCKF